MLAGASDEAVGREYGFSRHAVARHRANHIQAVAKAVAQMAGKGAEAREQREALADAAPLDPAVWLTLNSIAADLKAVHDRLERTADGAEADKQRMAVASLAGQSIRAIEARAKLAGIGQERSKEQGGAFQLRIFLGDKPVVIEGGAVIEGEAAFELG